MVDFEDSQEKGLKILEECDVVLRGGHYIYSSGNHGPDYVQIAAVQSKPEKMIELSNLFAEKIRALNPNLKIDSIVGPEVGAVIPAYQMAISLGIKECLSFKKNGKDENGKNKFELRPGCKIIPGNNYIVIEDVVTTGATLLEVAKSVESLGGNVVLATCFVDRSGGKKFDYPFISLVEMQLEIYKPDELPDWLAARPVVKPGSNNHCVSENVKLDNMSEVMSNKVAV